jgi:hypothetical protein
MTEAAKKTMNWFNVASKSSNPYASRSTERFAYFGGLAAVILCAHPVPLQAQDLTIHIKDFVQMPITGDPASKGSNSSLLARESYIREEPGGNKERLFITDLNGPLYILNKKTKQITTYLDFNGANGKSGLFHRLTVAQGFGNGFSNLQFDPDFAHNGKFYTIHIEDPDLPGSDMPDNTHFPGVNLDGYTLTKAIEKPGPTKREGVVIEWTAKNPASSTFEGTARELMRVQLGTVSHPMGDLIFNPTAKPGSPDWRVMYMSMGEGAAGESRDLLIRHTPQRLDVVIGKILRIIPDLDIHQDTSTVSDNGRYRIPNDNPFVNVNGARKEIWAYGFRNPQRMSWYVDPKDPSKDNLIVGVIGLHTWEWVDIVHKGANYGYSVIEGNELLGADNKTTKIPDADYKIPVEIGDTETADGVITPTAIDGMVTPHYPVIVYSHDKASQDSGDGICNGYVYNGKIAALRGKFIFGDITTGRIWWANYSDMLAVDGKHPSNSSSMTPIHRIKIVWDSPQAGKEPYDSIYQIGEVAYRARGGNAVPTDLPGRAAISGGRVDIRFGMDNEENLYILSKVDGTIREVVGATVSQ